LATLDYNSTLIWSCLGGKKGIISRGELKLIDIPSIDPCKNLHGVDAKQAKLRIKQQKNLLAVLVQYL